MWLLYRASCEICLTTLVRCVRVMSRPQRVLAILSADLPSETVSSCAVYKRTKLLLLSDTVLADYYSTSRYILLRAIQVSVDNG